VGALADIIAERPQVTINGVSSTPTLDEALTAAGVSG
jgi:hypothetical protein